MKERPILMTPENAQKCHDGRKTMTRRLNGLYRVNESPNDWAVMAHSSASPFWSFVHRTKTVTHGGGIVSIKCPYGIVGDRLWVREAWNKSTVRVGYSYKGLFDASNGIKGMMKWKPSIHMPRWACRTVLEITDVRVERLQEISEEDAKAEGIEYHNGGGIGHSGYRHSHSHGYVYATAKEAFKILWESINGAGSWAENPWVWVITFKRVQP